MCTRHNPEECSMEPAIRKVYWDFRTNETYRIFLWIEKRFGMFGTCSGFNLFVLSLYLILENGIRDGLLYIWLVIWSNWFVGELYRFIGLGRPYQRDIRHIPHYDKCRPRFFLHTDATTGATTMQDAPHVLQPCHIKEHQFDREMCSSSERCWWQRKSKPLFIKENV